MYRFGIIFSGMMCLSLVCSVTQAADDDKPAKKTDKASSGKKTLIRGYYAIIAKEIQLTDEQKVQLESALQARADARKDWVNSHADRDKQLSEAIKAAKKAKDKEKAKSLSDQQKKLRAQRDEPEAKFKAKLNEILTAKQRTHLAGYSLYVGTLQRISKAKATDEQKAKIKKMALDMAGDVPTNGDAKADKEFRAAFAEKAAQAVLSDEQREALTKKSEKKPDKK